MYSIRMTKGKPKPPRNMKFVNRRQICARRKGCESLLGPSHNFHDGDRGGVKMQSWKHQGGPVLGADCSPGNAFRRKAS